MDVPVTETKVSKIKVRKPSTRQIKKAVRSIEMFGLVAPVLLNGNGEIIDGNVRVQAARKLARGSRVYHPVKK